MKVKLCCNEKDCEEIKIISWEGGKLLKFRGKAKTKLKKGGKKSVKQSKY